MPKTIYMSTSDLENAVQTLLNAGCLENRSEAEKRAARQLEHVFPVTVGDPLDKIALADVFRWITASYR